MSDTALEPAVRLPGGTPLRTIRVASGKGGVGLANLTANLAVALASRGQSARVLDEAVPRAVREQRPIVLAAPERLCSVAITRLAARLAGPPPAIPTGGVQSFFRRLVDPEACV